MLSDFPGPCQDVTYQTLPGRKYGDGKINNLFLQCSIVKRSPLYCILGLMLQMNNTSRIHNWPKRAVFYPSVHIWMRESCVLSVSPYLAEEELCPIHQSLPGWGWAVSYQSVHIWLKKSCVLSIIPYLAEGELCPVYQVLPVRKELCPIYQALPGWGRALSYSPGPTWLRESCVLSISPYLAEGELCPTHQALPGWGRALSYSPGPTWLRESCVLYISPYLAEGELCPIHQSLPGWGRAVSYSPGPT